MIAIIDKLFILIRCVLFLLLHLKLATSLYSNWNYQTHQKQNIFLVFRSTFLNEPIKRMLFVMFSCIFTLVPIWLLRHHPRHEHFLLFSITMKEGVCQTENMVIEIINNFENDLPNIYHVLLPIIPNEFFHSMNIENL